MELTSYQISEFKSAFKILDNGSDGSISAKELGKVMNQLGVNYRQEEL